jgi:hypothetical protein
MTLPSTNLGPMNNRRRSQRVLLRMPILVIGIDEKKQPLSEHTHTSVVSAHGGLIHLTMKVRVGQLLIIRNPETSEEQSCRVSYVKPVQDGESEVGLDFITPVSNFWHVAFPPSDWSPQDPAVPSRFP